MSMSIKKGDKVEVLSGKDRGAGHDLGLDGQLVLGQTQGRIMFEISGVSEETAREALRLAQHKLPIKTKIVSRATSDTGEDK